MHRGLARAVGASIALAWALFTGAAGASTGTCDISPGDYTAYTGADPLTDPSPPTTTSGLTEARCVKTILSLGGFVVDGVFKDAKGRYANELPAYGKLFDMWPGEGTNGICTGNNAKGGRNVPGSYTCATPAPTQYKDFAAALSALDWNWTQGPRYDPAGRVECAVAGSGCYGGRCYDPACVEADGTLMSCPAGQICVKGACAAGDPTTLPTCTTLDAKPFVADGTTTFYDPWNALVFDLGGLANKVAIFAVNDHGPQPCESNEYTVYLTNNPNSREVIDNPAKDGVDPDKWNRAKLFKIYTHGWIDDADCYDTPTSACSCTGTACDLPKPGDPVRLEADSMTLVFSLPCGIAFRYASTIAGYDGKSLTDPALGADACAYHSFDDEVDAVAGLNDDESAICPDLDHDGYPTCDCTPKPSPCDCVDDPAKNPDAPKYHPGAPQACDGPQYSCAPEPCPPGTLCAEHQCLAPCAAGEFRCPTGFTCKDDPVVGDAGPDGGSTAEVCVPAPCGDAGVCPPGALCESGKCVDPCAPPTKCPFGQICQDGKCKDPCALIKCPTGQTCQFGLCHDNCACLEKTSSTYPCTGAAPTCDTKTGGCVPLGCDTTTCAAGEHCESSPAGPTCVAPCDGVVCPKGSTCDPVKGCATPCELRTTPCPTGTVCHESDGTCVDPACQNVECAPPFVCKSGTCVPPAGDGGCVLCDTGPTSDSGVPLDDASFADTGTSFADNPNNQSGGCGCTVPGNGASTAGALVGVLAALGAIARRRRRRH